MSDNFKEEQDLHKYIKMFEQIYEPIQNIERDFYQILARLLESIATCSQYVNKSNERGVADNLPKVFAWYCSLVFKSNLNDSISEAIWRKFPNCCPYCLSPRCTCSHGKKSLEDNASRLEEKAKDKDNKPLTLDNWQKMFATIYPRDPQGYDQRSNFAHLIEELGETSEAYRISYFHPSALGSELADVFTWIIGMANLLDSRARDGALYGYSDYRLSREVYFHYPSNCPNCRNSPCNCVTKQAKQKISELNVVYPADIIKIIHNLGNELQLGFTDEINNQWQQPGAQSFLHDLKAIADEHSATEESIKLLVDKLITQPEHRNWYNNIRASGLAESGIISVLTCLVQGFYK